MALLSGLEVRDLTVTVGAFRLGPISLEAPAGTATVVLGPSGAGKTTLLRAIAGFLPRTGGTVRLDGRSLLGLAPERRGIGFVPPDLGLFDQRRVRRNVGYPLELRGDPSAAAKTDRWLERFGLAALADRFPPQLSSGERQRVAMARALAAEPRLLLWDEPLSALDVESRDALLRLLRELLERERLPLVLVTHEPEVAFAVAARLVVLTGGVRRFDGPPEALVRGPLDRFSARFLGFENLLSAGELAAAGDGALAGQLAGVAGPGGLVVPSEAVRLSAPGPDAAGGEVASVRWTAGGWVVGVRSGGLLLHARTGRAPSGLRPGDRVELAVDVASCLPLTDAGEVPSR